MLAEIRLPGSDLPNGRDQGGLDAAAPAVWMEMASSVEEARAHSHHWQQLADKATARNIFYEPWNLLAALETVAASVRFQIMLVYQRAAGERRLIGLFPLEQKRRYKGLPARNLQLLKHIHCFLCTPLVDADHQDAALSAFADWAANDRRFSLLTLGGLSSAMANRLKHLLRMAEVRTITSNHSERAIFRPQQSADDYLRNAMRGRKLKDLRRKANRLGECGKLEYRVLAADDSADSWVDAFLDIEQRGWKGRAGTALACRAADARYFRRIVNEAQKMRRLDFVGYFLDNKPLALSCKFRAGDGAFAFKITFDEQYSRFSPGMLLEVEYIVHAHDDPSLCWMDSCADSGHSMANRLWSDRCGIDTLVAASGGYGRLLLAGTHAARGMWLRFRRLRLRCQWWPRGFQDG